MFNFLKKTQTVPHIISGEEQNITVVLKGKPYHVLSSDNGYSEVLQALKGGSSEEGLLLLLDKFCLVDNIVREHIKTDRFKVEDGELLFDGKPVHSSVAKKIILFYENNKPFEYLLRFLAKVLQNPSYTSQQELFDFLDHHGLPITEDGDFIAYKAVTSNFTDKWTGTKDNSLGKIVKERRGAVNDNRQYACSKGLHAGTIDFVMDYGNFSCPPENGGDRCIRIKINPANVVSVPLDSNCEKLRCCEYYVVEESTEELKDLVVKNDCSRVVTDDDYDDDDWDWEGGGWDDVWDDKL